VRKGHEHNKEGGRKTMKKRRVMRITRRKMKREARMRQTSNRVGMYPCHANKGWAHNSPMSPLLPHTSPMPIVPSDETGHNPQRNSPTSKQKYKIGPHGLS
jgi:hypothetical protein